MTEALDTQFSCRHSGPAPYTIERIPGWFGDGFAILDADRCNRIVFYGYPNMRFLSESDAMRICDKLNESAKGMAA